MANDGMSAANLANKFLSILVAGTAFASPPSNLYFKLHTATPGAAGTSAASAVVTRVVAPYAAPSGGVASQTGTMPSWSMTTTETITDISIWDALTTGNFLWSFPLTTPQPVVNTNTLTMTSYSLAFTPIAA